MSASLPSFTLPEFVWLASTCGMLQELKQMMQQAATREPSQPDEPNWETTYQSEHQAKTMEGLQ